jgi:acetamidase/formamidase
MKATVDRIEGTVAVLVTRDGNTERITVPVSLLPEGCREGDVVTIGIEQDAETTAAAQSTVRNLIDRLKKKQE